jgi:uncharacterized Tic20 family protein
MIHPGERTWAAIAHLSGFGGYLVPLGGVIAPIVIMLAKKESPVVSTIAKQALILNIACVLSAIPIVIMFFSFIMIPLAILASILVGLAAVVLPIVGAVRAGDGYYYKYPLVGQDPY